MSPMSTSTRLSNGPTHPEGTTTEASQADQEIEAQSAHPSHCGVRRESLRVGSAPGADMNSNVAVTVPVATKVLVEAVHHDGLLCRLAVVLNAHQVPSFHYRTDEEHGLATVEIMVDGDEWQVTCVANKLRRVIAVTQVVVVPSPTRIVTSPGFASLGPTWFVDETAAIASLRHMVQTTVAAAGPRTTRARVAGPRCTRR